MKNISLDTIIISIRIFVYLIPEWRLSLTVDNLVSVWGDFNVDSLDVVPRRASLPLVVVIVIDAARRRFQHCVRQPRGQRRVYEVQTSLALEYALMGFYYCCTT